VNQNVRRARWALAVGGLLLALAVGLTVWDASGDDEPDAPTVITGERE